MFRTSRRLRRTVGVVIGACGLALLAALWAESRDPNSTALPKLDELLLFYPTRYPTGQWQPDDLNYQDVWFTASDGVKLHGWYCPAEDPVAAVLFCHGNAGNLSDRRFLLEHLQTQHRLSVFIFDYRGYGRSAGAPSVRGALLDAAAARKELARLAGVDTPDVVLMGRSLGAAIAIQLAAQEAPRGLIAESPFSSMRDIAAYHYPALAWFVPAEKLNSLAAIKRYKGPYLQSHGTADTIVPFASGQKLFDAANEPKRLIRLPHANHNDPQPPEYYQALDEFLGSLPTPE